MASLEIVWISVPGGIHLVEGDVRARVSVFVSPRLQVDDDRLTGTFLNWPARLQDGDVTFEVTFDGVSRAATIRNRGDLRMWGDLFDSNTFVRGYSPDATSGMFQSYAAARLHDVIRAGYQEIFESAPLDPLTEILPPSFDALRTLFVPQTVAPRPAGFDEEARAELGRGIFRPADADSMQERLDELVDRAAAAAQSERDDADQPRNHEIIPDTGDPAVDLARFALFHRKPRGTSFAPGEPTADDARIDFHQQLANLGEYPALQRNLGLIIDLDVNIAGVPHTEFDSHGLLRVAPRFGAPLVPATTFITPDTAYVLSDTDFHAAPSGPPPRDVERGLLNLALTIGDTDEPQFRIIQVDVDSAGDGAIALLAQAANGGRPDAAAGLATLRSSGVSIARYGNGRFLLDVIGIGLAKMAAISAGRTDETLFAEHLIRGYRVDVREAGSEPWRSLHERAGVYRSTRRRLLLFDEGFLQPSLVQPPPPGPSSTTHDPSAPNYVAESLFLWQGWSLAARRPGPAMAEPASTGAATPAPASDMKLHVSFSATHGTLPRLRFGKDYEFRMRLADLVGGGLDSDEADAVLAALEPAVPRPVLPAAGESFRYLRFDAVPSPVVLPRIAVGRGATVERVVLRSNHDVTADTYAQQHPQFPEYALSGERHIVPPKTWQLLAEASGLFDSSIGTAADLERTHELTLRAGRSLGDNEVHPEPVITVPYLPDPLAVGAALRDVPGVPTGTLGRVESDALHLDRVLAAGALAGPESVVTVGFDQEWPDRKGFRIRLGEGSHAPRWDAAQRVLSVFLPKGETRTINVSSHLAGGPALDSMGMWTWLVERLDQRVSQGEMGPTERDDRIAQLRRLSVLGQSWMITPPRQLTLVHAVQQPLAQPVIRRFVAVRLPGRTYAEIDAVIGVHGATTGQLELRWTSSDTPSPAPGAPVLPTAFVLPPAGESTLPATPGEPKPIAAFDAATSTVTFHAPNIESLDRGVEAAVADLVAEVAALRARVNAPFAADEATRTLIQQAESRLSGLLIFRETLLITAKWRFLADVGAQVRGWVQDWVGNPADIGTDPQLPPDFHLDALGVDVMADALTIAAEDVFAGLEGFQARHEFGDTKYRRVTYRAVATTRFGDCFPESADVELTRASVELEVDVLNTATPPRPRIAYVVPAFGWRRQGTADRQGFTSERDGGGLRVYLDGPWFESGEGELLGVAVVSIPEVSMNRPANPEETNWARDPLWDTDSPRFMPARDDFRNASTVVDDVRVPSGLMVTMVGYPVDTDDSGRHYCDITLDPAGSYYPFVRLALTRFQPHSIPGAQSSPVVLADFAQLAPHRSVSVAPREQLLFDVTVSGITHRSSTDPAGGSGTGTRVRVSVQERIPGTVDDAGWTFSDDAVVTPQDGQLWSGTVQIPNRPPGTLQLLIEELEDHARFQQLPIERVVFAETVPL